MYLEHFGLRGKPFSLAFEPACYYPAAHQEAANDLCYSIEERQGLATLVGEPGTGKTTLLHNLVKTFDSNMRGILVSDASLGTSSLLRTLTAELGLPVADPPAVPGLLRGYLQSWVSLGKTLVVLIDEAQSLTSGQLEEVRHLTNMELQGSHGKKLAEIVLAGQPSLESKLAARQFEALRQRIAVRTYLKPLGLEHTAAYIQWRLEAVGATDSRFFGLAAIQAVHRRSRGVPRLINLLCDRALLAAFADNHHSVQPATIEAAADELGIDQGSSTSSLVRGRPGFSEATENVAEAPARELEERLAAIERKLDRLLEILGPPAPNRLEPGTEDPGGETPGPSSAGEEEEVRLAPVLRVPRGAP